MRDIMEQWWELVFFSDTGAYRSSPQSTVLVLLLAFLIGQWIGWVYIWTYKALSYSQSFSASLVVLPVIVAVMMKLMSGSMLIAFGLLAVFAVVRFRNVLKDTRDTTYVLWAIVEGMAVGTLQPSTAVLSTIVIGGIMLYLRFTQFGSRQNYDLVVNLCYVGDPTAHQELVPTVLSRHAIRSQLANSRASDADRFDLSYRVLLRDPSRLRELQSELESTRGVESVSMYLREDESEV